MSLEKFIKAQERVYEIAINEMKQGCKKSHWIWFIFPQIKGLGKSYNSEYYGIENIDEARRYLRHQILGKRLYEITNVLLKNEEKSIINIFGFIDSLKVKSSMTLFSLVSNNDIFQKVLDKYFDNQKDTNTLTIIDK